MQRDVVIDCYYMLTLYHKLLLIDFMWINFELLRLRDTVDICVHVIYLEVP